ncbi:MAG: spore germination protein, partial [Clostridia bacterium]
MELTGRLSTDIKAFRDELKDDDTIVFRMFKNKINSSFCGCVIFTETLVSTQIIDQYIVAPLIRCECAGTIALQTVAEKILEANEVRCEPSLAKAINGILIGDTVILIDGAKSAIVANSKMYQTRSVGIPETENAVNGPKEAFTELLVFNMGLIRRKVKNPRLKLKIIEVGRVTKTRVCITYIE